LPQEQKEENLTLKEKKNFLVRELAIVQHVMLLFSGIKLLVLLGVMMLLQCLHYY